MKIREFWDENKNNIILAGLVVLSILFALFYIYMAKKDEEERGGVYDVSIPSHHDNHINWDDVDVDRLTVVSEDMDVGVYSAELYTIDDIEALLDRFGFINPSLDISETGDIYMWDLGDKGYASYTPDIGGFMFESEGLGLSAISLGYISENNAESYFNSFVTEYLHMDAEFDVEVKDTGSDIKVTGTWSLDGYNVVSSIDQESMIGVVFNERGDLKSLSVSLIRFRAKEDTVSLITVDELKEYLQWGSYPREEYTSVLLSGNSACEDYDCYFNYDIGDVSNINLASTELVYYLNPFLPDSVLPAYKLVGEGEVEDEEGQSIIVEVLVYTSAIDPTRIRTRPGQ